MSETSEIKKKYLKEPTIEQVLSFIEEVGVSYAHFEYYYGMAEGTIRNFKCGVKKLAVRYWPIFYERIIPKYGTYNNFSNPVKKSAPKSAPTKVCTLNSIIPSSHSRLTSLKP
jgi:hypothetical protein